MSSEPISQSVPESDTPNTLDSTVQYETFSRGPSEEPSALSEDIAEVSQKKKKKKKPKKSATAKAKEAAEKAAKAAAEANKPAVLCISRNKHWKYISSYHGPWLQLPLELLESLLLLNLDPATLAPSELQNHIPTSISSSSTPTSYNKSRQKDKARDRGFHALSSNDGAGTFTNPNGLSVNISANNAFPLPPPLPSPEPGKAAPPPIDPGVFRNVTSIRRLIDEAAELSVRASSGLSAAELGSMRSSGSGAFGYGGGMGLGLNGNGYGAWNAAQTLGINPMGNGGGGRNVAMSAMRIHRLRALAVQKLAQAYKADEIASSVMVMQGGSVFDDVAEKVLKVDPNDADARYVHFFHEKIPSRQLAESTNTQLLDELIRAQPQRLELYRTRGIVHCFRDEYPQATKDFTFALKEARAARKAKMSHVHGDSVGTTKGTGGKSGKTKGDGKGGKGKGGKKKKNAHKQNGSSFPTGVDDIDDDGGDSNMLGPDTTPTPSAQQATPAQHPSTLEDAPDPLEPQLLFLRGAAYLSHAVHLIETAVLELEGVVKAPTLDGAELRLCYLEDGKYGGVEVGNPDGPLGKSGGEKVRRYREVLAESKHGKRTGFREKVEGLLRKSLRDHERFLSHFDTLESGPPPLGMANLRKKRNEEYITVHDPDTIIKEGQVELLSQTECAFYISESIRPGNHNSMPSSPGSPYSPTCGSYFPEPQSSNAMFTTYHPLLVESHFSILLCLLLLGDFATILPTFARTATLVDGLEGYPIFLPPRSMAQAEFIEVLERLAGGWSHGCKMSWAERARLRMERAVNEDRLIEGGSIVEATDEEQTTPTLGTTHHLHASLGESSSSSSSSLVATPSRSNTPVSGTTDSYTGAWVEPRQDAVEALECARILLAPVIARQRERVEKARVEKAEQAAERARAASAALVKARGSQEKGLIQANGNEAKQKKPVPINIPLHGPRVEVILAWMGAVHLPELEGGDIDGHVI
ncbi:hypothetical protein VNI00_004615 [Paramarasmius palmivorus]|uniref:Uncharacterized protein n=1 Tax=Paramarasmius palmivorus TaxID=297713 RepID=A0AAW0DKX1_9AGAR